MYWSHRDRRGGSRVDGSTPYWGLGSGGEEEKRKKWRKSEKWVERERDEEKIEKKVKREVERGK